MKKFLVLSACMVFLLAGLAEADTLNIGATFTYPIYSILDGTTQTVEGGGSVEVSYLNGVKLEYLYCVDVFRNVNVPGTYPETDVNNIGNIYGSPLNNAGEVAWLLSNYGTAGQGDKAYALQAAIWHVVYEGTLHSYDLDTGLGKSTTIQINLYNSYLAALDSNTGDVSDFLWITPGKDNIKYQGLVTKVPEPGTLILLGSGLLGLALAAKRKFRK